MGLGVHGNIDIDQCELMNSSIHEDKLLMKCMLESGSGGVPGQVFAVLVHLHLPALKLIQLLTDSSLRGKTSTHTHTRL